MKTRSSAKVPKSPAGLPALLVRQPARTPVCTRSQAQPSAVSAPRARQLKSVLIQCQLEADGASNGAGALAGTQGADAWHVCAAGATGFSVRHATHIVG